jgi:hypothetical protein
MLLLRIEDVGKSIQVSLVLVDATVPISLFEIATRLFEIATRSCNYNVPVP